MLEQMGIAGKAASYTLAQLSAREKNRVLEKIADYLEAQTETILLANAEDVEEARRNGLSEAMLDRLPNVTVDVASLCLKTGNAAILRGGKETWRTNAATVKVIQQALEECGLPAGAVQAIESPDRALVNEMLRMDKYIDMLIPRGGAGLHKLCREQST
ncbi:MAG: proA, partial [Enterobacter kobei]|nr:proA [Enterobacter kobei]